MIKKEVKKSADKTEKKQRIVGKPFPKGQSGNPNGRPKGTKNFTTKVREALEKISEYKGKNGEEITNEIALIDTILEKAIKDKSDQMIKLIWNYLDGMPIQNLDHTSGGKDLSTLFDLMMTKKHDNTKKP